jgi:hypothetical protein
MLSHFSPRISFAVIVIAVYHYHAVNLLAQEASPCNEACQDRVVKAGQPHSQPVRILSK